MKLNDSVFSSKYSKKFHQNKFITNYLKYQICALGEGGAHPFTHRIFPTHSMGVKEVQFP